MQHLIFKSLAIAIFSMISVAADASRYEIYEQNASGVVVIFSGDGGFQPLRRVIDSCARVWFTFDPMNGIAAMRMIQDPAVF